MKTAFLLLVAAAGCLLTGCSTTAREKFDQNERAIRTLNINSRATLVAGEAVAANDPDRVRPALQLIEMNEKDNAAVASAVDARLAKVEAFNKELIQSLTAVAQKVADGVVPGAGAAVAIIGGQLSAAVESAHKVQEKQGEQTRQIDRQETELDSLQATQKELETALAEKNKDLTELKSSLEKTSASLTAKVENLPADDQARVKEAILAELRDRGLSPAELAKYQEMSPAQLTGLVGGGGLLGLAAVTALLRTFGASRGKKEIDELWEESSTAKEKLAKLATLEDETRALRERQTELQVKIAAQEATNKSAGTE